MQPEAVEAFDRGTAARLADDFTAVLAAYEQVHQLAPQFSHALRRMCHAEERLDRIEAARQHCREALALADIPENQVALANVLLTSEKGTAPAEANVVEAARLLTRAEAADPSSAYVHLARCRLAMLRNSQEDLGDCSARLIAIEPEQPIGYYFRAIYFASTEDLLEAEAQLDAAESRGLPPETTARFRAALAEATPIHLVAWTWVQRIGIPWAVGLALLAILGFGLSAATLASAKRTSGLASAQVSGGSAVLRKLYAIVLWLACAYYYLSLPLVLLMIVAGGGGVIYGFLALGRIPVKLVVLIAIIALSSMGAVFKALRATFARGGDEDPGERIDLAEHPRLEAVLREVAEKIGTRPVDRVFLDVDATIAVFERGGIYDQMRQRSERCLLLGIAALDGMKLGELKAILAHEYGHFKNEDTAGGGFALAVRRSMLTMAIGLAQSGAATWYNPAWLFFRAFYWLFMRISQGASRLQEILADRWAALAYGSDAFVRGLRHVIRRAVEFDAHLQASFADVVERKLALHNLYTHEPTADPEHPKALEEAVEEAWAREPSAFDSHPCPRDREEWVRAMNAGEPNEADAGDEAWALFSDREAIQTKMTSAVRDRVLINHGLDIHAPAPAQS